MGWLELLPLLRRVLPLLDRLTPLLESALVGRSAARAESEKNRSGIDELTQSQAGLVGLLERQHEQMTQLGDELQSLSVAYAALQGRLADLEESHKRSAAMLRTAAAVIVVLLLLVVGLLVFLVVHRS